MTKAVQESLVGRWMVIHASVSFSINCVIDKKFLEFSNILQTSGFVNEFLEDLLILAEQVELIKHFRHDIYKHLNIIKYFSSW